MCLQDVILIRTRSHRPFISMCNDMSAVFSRQLPVTTNRSSTDIVNGVGGGDDALVNLEGEILSDTSYLILDWTRDLALAKLSGVRPVKVFRYL